MVNFYRVIRAYLAKVATEQGELGIGRYTPDITPKQRQEIYEIVKEDKYGLRAYVRKNNININAASYMWVMSQLLSAKTTIFKEYVKAGLLDLPNFKKYLLKKALNLQDAQFYIQKGLLTRSDLKTPEFKQSILDSLFPDNLSGIDYYVDSNVLPAEEITKLMPQNPSIKQWLLRGLIEHPELGYVESKAKKYVARGWLTENEMKRALRRREND